MFLCPVTGIDFNPRLLEGPAPTCPYHSPLFAGPGSIARVALPEFEDRRLSFGAGAEAYADYRPGYPQAALDWVLSAATCEVATVADVGAGTGALTQQLAEAGFSVEAFDADVDMLAELVRRVPGVSVRKSAAESLPLSNGDVDAVFAAQAWHWFAQPATAQEFLRVVRPGGVIGLFWNNRDSTVPWLRELADLVDGSDAASGGVEETTADIRSVLPSAEHADFSHTVLMRPEHVLGLVSTLSNVNRRSDATDVYSSVLHLLATHPDTTGRTEVEMHYVTVAYRVPRS
jgi:SAM-dependent methyltransferase